MPHLRRLRIHTRLPIVLPERVDADLARLAARPAVAGDGRGLHANHANEFDAAVDAACARLRDAGATLLNQAVLLRGVNDWVDALAGAERTRLRAPACCPTTCTSSTACRARRISKSTMTRATRLHRALAARLPGYLVPRLVREVAGDPGKAPAREFVRSNGRGDRPVRAITTSTAVARIVFHNPARLPDARDR